MFPFLKKMRESRRPFCSALVAAAGSSSRMGGLNKLLEPLDGIPVLVRTLTALQSSQRVDEIVVATREEDLVEISQLCRTYGISKCTKVIRGGDSRVHSVLLAALEAVEDKSGPVVRCNPNTIYHQINRVCARNGLPQVGTHGLRHSFASLGYHLGVPELEMMQLGGWADNQTMIRIYTHIANADRVKAENAMAGFFSQNANENANSK